MAEGFQERMVEAWKRLEIAQRRDVGGLEFGRLVGKQLGRKAYAPAIVSRWRTGKTEPDLAEIEAIAAVCGVRPAWLAFGEGVSAPDAPVSPVGDFAAPAKKAAGKGRKR